MSKNLEAFTSSSLRGQKRGIYQQLLASLLVKAVKTNDPLEKIQALCEAAYTCRIQDKLDMDLVDVCYEVCQSFINSKTTKRYGCTYVHISWSFNLSKEENYKKYIEPWKKQTYSCFEWFTSFTRTIIKDGSEYNQTNLDYINAELRKLPQHKQFYYGSEAMTVYSFRALKGSFCTWALKQLLQIQAVLSDEIDPQVWREATGQQEPEEKTGDGDSLD